MIAKLTSTDSFLAPFEAVKFILKNKKIWHYIIIPIIINVIVFLILGGFAYWFLFDQLSEWFAFSEAWYISAILTILQALAGIVVFFVVIALITLTANIFAAPFNEILSHRTEEILKGKKIKEKGHVIKSIGQEIIIFILFIIAQIFLFLLNFIPGIGTIIYLI
ncbi:EI24 domain-containing protein, partial [Patescibacteria group bacterium]|nr:EI24 domain-containing protein [Patescibacteria group bacterium]